VRFVASDEDELDGPASVTVEDAARAHERLAGRNHWQDIYT
jgi:hypothetical protein